VGETVDLFEAEDDVVTVVLIGEIAVILLALSVSCRNAR
jgi:hypothetical protein